MPIQVVIAILMMFGISAHGGQKIKIAGTVSYFASQPKGQKYPTVILIPEWWGLTPFVKTQADKLSAQFKINVLAMDLFGGKTATDVGQARNLADKTVTSQAAGIIKRSFDILKKLPDTDTKKIGILGFGFGAKIALNAAMELPELKAVALYYGQPVMDVSRLQKIKCPLLAIFADQDKSIPPDTVAGFEKALTEAHVDKRVHVIRGAREGFANPSMLDYFNGKATLEAEKYFTEFLNQRLLQKY